MTDAAVSDAVKQALCLHGVVGECPVCGDNLSDGDHSWCAESLRVVAVGRRTVRNVKDYMDHLGEPEKENVKTT